LLISGLGALGLLGWRRKREMSMRGLAIILGLAASAECGAVLAQTTTPNVVTPNRGYFELTPHFHHNMGRSRT
jgi:hypothetical protein